MFEFFKDSPALQWMEESGRADERRKAELQLQEARKQAEQQLRSEQKKAELQLRSEQKKALAAFRQTVVGFVAGRFPTLQRLAKTQARALKQPERFQQVMIDLALAQDVDAAQNVLLSLDDTEDEEDAQESNQSL